MYPVQKRRFRLCGIPVLVDLSWLLVVVLLTAALAALFDDQLPGLGGAACWALALVTALAFFACLVLHELGHAAAARAVGVPVRRITLFLFGGVAELEGEPRSARDEFVLSVAGPIVSAALATLFGVAAVLGADAGWPAGFVVVLFSLAWINTAVLALNMVPAFPLDGGRVVRAFLWGLLGDPRRATRWAAALGQTFAWLVIATGVLNLMDGHLAEGLLLCLVGVFVHHAAGLAPEPVPLRLALRGEPVSRMMNREPIAVPPALDLRHWVDDYVYRYHHRTFPVASNGHVEGVIATPALVRFPREEWDRHTVAEAMRRDVEALTIRPDTDALDALGRMERTHSGRLLVTDHDELVGVVSLKDVLDFLDRKVEDDRTGRRR